jgi:hypothetical protein
MADNKAIPWTYRLAFGVAAIALAIVPNVVLTYCTMPADGVELPPEPPPEVRPAVATFGEVHSMDGSGCHAALLQFRAEAGQRAWAARWSDGGACTLTGQTRQ